MTYTKGSWEAVEQGNGIQSESGEHEVITDIDGNLINICQTFSGQFETDDLPAYILSREESLANARLIAAAPDLLAALENLLANDWHKITISEKSMRSAAGRAAISKAKGESK